MKQTLLITIEAEIPDGSDVGHTAIHETKDAAHGIVVTGASGLDTEFASTRVSH